MCLGFGIGYEKFLLDSIECLHARVTLLSSFLRVPGDLRIKPDGETRQLLGCTVCVVERRLELLASGLLVLGRDFAVPKQIFLTDVWCTVQH
jgi:hypothetical protein